MTDGCDCADRLDRIEDRVDSLASVVGHLNGELESEKAEREEISRELNVVRRQLAEVQQSTSMLNDIKTGSSDVREKRMAKILLTLRNKAERNGGSATMDAGNCHDALNQEPDRTTMYGLMDDLADLVGTDAVRYVKEDKSADRNSRLILDESKGPVPATFEGHDVTGQEVA